MTAFRTFSPRRRTPGSLVVKLYPTGGTVRGYVRKTAVRADDDTVFPGEEMGPEAAFVLARSHAEGMPIEVELVEGVSWDPVWGTLEDGSAP
ncbi:hypothetical protein BJF93_09310 [Xaviernesmea oryzae]|uniref:Uncharacterized protein n=1 Tax=Xaviernesmea oryzae TaxID=464029 RepID=A0A1Q9AWH7_9HYPH|nr:hypothetical protein [Xaviernesmea oryzae]OLP59806.1 hypothetical protein BJF93_09310 [Xaviernesmea oryzae]SEK51173.1 hypothetical protein SAMN04487976_102354 [Xaviernesmea oryzae]